MLEDLVERRLRQREILHGEVVFHLQIGKVIEIEWAAI